MTNLFKVTLDIDGKVLAVERATPEDIESTELVFFVEADDEQRAGVLAFKMYQASQRVQQRQRRAIRIKKGLCPNCGRKRSKRIFNGKRVLRCDVCLDGHKVAGQRHHKKKLGESLAPLPPKSEAIARNREAREREVRREVMEQVERNLWKMKSKDFWEWVESEVLRLGGKLSGPQQVKIKGAA